MIEWKRAEQFFLKAASTSYAADAPKTTSADVPGERAYRHKQGPFRYLDRYCVGRNGWSFGETLEWHEECLIWWMQYYGENKQIGARTFLKIALLEAYRRGAFCGGRGPENFTDKTLAYRNRWKGDFRLFSGEERILDTRQSHRVIFWHRFRGGILIG